MKWHRNQRARWYARRLLRAFRHSRPIDMESDDVTFITLTEQVKPNSVKDLSGRAKKKAKKGPKLTAAVDKG